MANHIQIPNEMFEAISALGLAQNERRIVDLILRCSLGCQGKGQAFLIQRDFTVTGIAETHIKKILERLVQRRIIFWDKINKLFWVNPAIIEMAGYEKPRFTAVLSKNLQGKEANTYKKGKQKLTKSVSSNDYKIPTLSHNTEAKDIKDKLKTTKTGGDYEKLLEFLSTREDVTSPKGLLTSITSNYGERALHQLVVQNVGFSQWIQHLDYWKKDGII